MRFRAALTLVAALATACAAQPSADSTRKSGSIDIGASVFLYKTGGWVLSSPQPAFPYNSEPDPKLEAMSGAAGTSPFGCGLTSVRSGYFSGRRGLLTCVMRERDGRLGLHTIGGRTVFNRVYDATRLQDRFVVVAEIYGRAGARAFTLDADGRVLETADLLVAPVEQAVILPTGRIAVVGRQGPACVWTMLAKTGDRFQPVSTATADKISHCHSATSGGELLRDQVSGQAHLLSRYPETNLLYRIDDNGDRSPATVAAADFGRDAKQEPGSRPEVVTVNGGAVWFNAGTLAGPVIGRYDLATGATRFTDFTSPTGRWQDAGRVYGLMASQGQGSAPRLALMDARSGDTRVIPLEP